MFAAALGLALALVLVLALRRSFRRKIARLPSGRERFDAPRPGGVVVLVGVPWERTTLDGERLDAGDIDRPEGIDVVFPGRHRLETDLGGRVAIWDFVLWPGEVVARRLDRERAEWVPSDVPAGEGPPRLVAFARKPRVSPDEVVADARRRIRALLARLESGEPTPSAVAQASKIGDALVGVPLARSQADELRGPFELAARAALERGSAERARATATAGLAVLPGDRALLSLSR